MKKLIVTLLLVCVQVAVFANTDSNKTSDNKKKKKATFTETVEERIVIKPIQRLSQPATDKVTVVVVNTQGETISKQEVHMRDFLSASASSIVPKGSNFLMFFEGTAFYVAN
jgi:hypothetical protein